MNSNEFDVLKIRKYAIGMLAYRKNHHRNSMKDKLLKHYLELTRPEVYAGDLKAFEEARKTTLRFAQVDAQA